MGVFISFEGGDGAGKGTQSHLLDESLHAAGADVVLESFPRYSGPLGGHFSDYLNGEFGEQVHPRLASTLYSTDRLLVRDAILTQVRKRNGVYVADRFSDSNKGHQGAKLHTRDERLAFFDAQDAFEHDELGVPRPDKTILLPVPGALAQVYVDKKNARLYTDRKRDILEADADHLQQAYETFLLLAEQNPDRIVVIDPVEANGKAMRSIEAIHQDILHALRPLLEERLGIILP